MGSTLRALGPYLPPVDGTLFIKHGPWSSLCPAPSKFGFPLLLHSIPFPFLISFPSLFLVSWVFRRSVDQAPDPPDSSLLASYSAAVSFKISLYPWLGLSQSARKKEDSIEQSDFGTRCIHTFRKTLFCCTFSSVHVAPFSNRRSRPLPHVTCIRNRTTHALDINPHHYRKGSEDMTRACHTLA